MSQEDQGHGQGWHVMETPAPAPGEKVCCASKREEFKDS